MALTFPLIPDHWYYNTESGQLTKGNNLLNLGNNLVGGAGWHELNIPASATAAQAAAEAVKEFPTGKKPTTEGLKTRIPQAVAQGVKDAVSSVLKATFSITGFSGTNFTLRLIKVVAGGIILIVGLAKLTGADKSIGGVAKTAVKVAPLL